MDHLDRRAFESHIFKNGHISFDSHQICIGENARDIYMYDHCFVGYDITMTSRSVSRAVHHNATEEKLTHLVDRLDWDKLHEDLDLRNTRCSEGAYNELGSLL